MRVSYSKISRSSVTSVKRRPFVRMCVINGFRLRRYFVDASFKQRRSSERPWVGARDIAQSDSRRVLHFDCQSVIFGCLLMTARWKNSIIAIILGEIKDGIIFYYFARFGFARLGTVKASNYVRNEEFWGSLIRINLSLLWKYT